MCKTNTLYSPNRIKSSKHSHFRVIYSGCARQTPYIQNHQNIAHFMGHILWVCKTNTLYSPNRIKSSNIHTYIHQIGSNHQNIHTSHLWVIYSGCASYLHIHQIGSNHQNIHTYGSYTNLIFTIGSNHQNIHTSGSYTLGVQDKHLIFTIGSNHQNIHTSGSYTHIMHSIYSPHRIKSLKHSHFRVIYSELCIPYIHHIGSNH